MPENSQAGTSNVKSDNQELPPHLIDSAVTSLLSTVIPGHSLPGLSVRAVPALLVVQQTLRWFSKQLTAHVKLWVV